MIGRVSLALLEWTAASVAVGAAVQAASAGSVEPMLIAAIAAIAAASTRSLAISRAAGRRFDGMMRTLRDVTRPANDDRRP
ncbi:hypothetical protein [Methylobacterium iners]|uniref:Uncharacterized protein n=1 Tax=Methylobacterium iners TaxID=418707 RepID=A0ABQ4S3P1_9HYPH|nr:hypothetical protein [Methylobacterium iners]GJD97746.1 hypothetical protein OCOJLMKI_4979 [Methylobacterium iners]